MGTLAALLISRSVLLRGQPAQLCSLVGETLATFAHLLGI